MRAAPVFAVHDLLEIHFALVSEGDGAAGVEGVQAGTQLVTAQRSEGRLGRPYLMPAAMPFAGGGTVSVL